MQYTLLAFHPLQSFRTLKFPPLTQSLAVDVECAAGICFLDVDGVVGEPFGLGKVGFLSLTETKILRACDPRNWDPTTIPSYFLALCTNERGILTIFGRNVDVFG
jgi:hypothetical protein